MARARSYRPRAPARSPWSARTLARLLRLRAVSGWSCPGVPAERLLDAGSLRGTGGPQAHDPDATRAKLGCERPGEGFDLGAHHPEGSDERNRPTVWRGG